jgi:hypothetical protein
MLNCRPYGLDCGNKILTGGVSYETRPKGIVIGVLTQNQIVSLQETSMLNSLREVVVTCLGRWRVTLQGTFRKDTGLFRLLAR